MNLSDEVDLYVRGLAVRPSQVEIDTFKVLCERTGLSPIARQIYLVGRKDRDTGKTKYTAQTSIDGFRTIAARNPRYAGQDGPFYATDEDRPWTDIPPRSEPYAAKAVVRMLSDGHTAETPAVATWAQYNAGTSMWKKFPSTMLAKCAEALALRKAFPAEMAGLYTSEEMAQAGKENVAPEVTYEAVEALIGSAVQNRDKDALKAVVKVAQQLPEEDQTRAAAAIRTAAQEIAA